ncbi:hypothetical protein AT6N2_C2447 [Agrobacterium tumefaciens]|nr:hypothetical protein AT6N2_C2447 [Agrobacterium tumefaciens]
MTINRRGEDRHVGMGFAEILDTFRSCQQTKEADVLRAALLQLLNGSDGGVAGCQHGIDDDDQTGVEAFGRFEVIFDGFQRVMIAINADMGDARRRHKFQHAFQKAIAGTKDGGKNKFFSLENGCLDGFKRRVDGLHRHFKITRHFIAEQRRDFAQQAAEAGRGGFLLAHDGEFVPHQRMFDDCDAVHETGLSLSHAL